MTEENRRVALGMASRIPGITFRTVDEYLLVTETIYRWLEGKVDVRLPGDESNADDDVAQLFASMSGKDST